MYNQKKSKNKTKYSNKTYKNKKTEIYWASAEKFTEQEERD